jgi:hypothetical protein
VDEDPTLATLFVAISLGPVVFADLRRELKSWKRERKNRGDREKKREEEKKKRVNTTTETRSQDVQRKVSPGGTEGDCAQEDTEKNGWRHRADWHRKWRSSTAQFNGRRLRLEKEEASSGYENREK